MSETPKPDEVSAALVAITRILQEDAGRLTPCEATALREILDHKDDLVEMMRYRAAQKLLAARWRSTVISLAAFVAAAALLWDRLVAFVGGLLK